MIKMAWHIIRPRWCIAFLIIALRYAVYLLRLWSRQTNVVPGCPKGDRIEQKIWYLMNIRRLNLNKIGEWFEKHNDGIENYIQYKQNRSEVDTPLVNNCHVLPFCIPNILVYICTVNLCWDTYWTRNSVIWWKYKRQNNKTWHLLLVNLYFTEFDHNQICL